MTFLPQFWHRIEAEGNLHLTFHYVPKEEVNIGFNFIFPCLRLKTSSEAQRILTFKCGIIQGTTLRQHDRWDIKLTKIDLKTPHIYGQASFFYQKGKEVGYTLQARDLNIEEIRKYWNPSNFLKSIYTSTVINQAKKIPTPPNIGTLFLCNFLLLGVS